MIPFIDNKTAIVNLRVQQLDVTIETKTLDNVFVNLQVSVQYQVRREYVKEAYYSLENAKNQIASYVFDDVRAEVPKLELDDVFAKKEDIAVAVQAEQVVHPHAVNGQAVETRVGASTLHCTTGVSGVNIDPWVVIDYVAQIAVDVWHFLQVCQAENR